MRPQFVELIVEIADGGSLAAAAKRMNKTQPAITKALKTAESELGAPIFHRLPHGVTPTIEGQAVIQRCRLIANELSRLDEEVSQIGGDFSGLIRVVVSPLAALQIIPPVMRRFRARFPKMRVEITSGHAPKAFQPIRSAEADFAIGPAPLPGADNGLAYRQLFATPVSFITGANSKYLHETDPKVLQQADWMMIGLKDRRPAYCDYFEGHNLTPPIPKIYSESILSILSNIEGSDLLCSFPSLALPDVRHKWSVGVLPVGIEVASIVIALTSARYWVPTPAALAFADLVVEEARKIARPDIT